MEEEFNYPAEKPLLNREEILGANLPQASRTNRFLAYFIDALIFTGVNLVIIGVFAGILALTSTLGDEAAGIIGTIVSVFFILYYLFGFLLFFGYMIYQENKYGSTIGKRLFNLKVVDRQGDKPNFNTLLGRNASRLIPFEALFILGEKKETLHDMISNTRVVQDNPIHRKV